MKYFVKSDSYDRRLAAGIWQRSLDSYMQLPCGYGKITVRNPAPFFRSLHRQTLTVQDGDDFSSQYSFGWLNIGIVQAESFASITSIADIGEAGEKLLQDFAPYPGS